MEIPGVLGFDFKFDVRSNKNEDNRIQIELNNFNTFFNGARGSVKIKSETVLMNLLLMRTLT